MDINIEHRLTEVEQRTKSNCKRLDDLEKRQDNLDDLVSTVKVLAVREEQVENDVKEIKADVKTLSNSLVESKNEADKKNAEKWDKIVNTAITVIVSAIVGFALAQFGF